MFRHDLTISAKNIDHISYIYLNNAHIGIIVLNVTGEEYGDLLHSSLRL